KEFKELHHLVKRSIGPLAELIGDDIPESETTYVTMLIGGWMNRQGESIEEKIKAVVVCPQGVSVSKLMFNELKELFP
ncbi:transcription antiterminator BglG, partial [Staphylococcus sp. SIMBA_130]